ncbi:MAG: hypothetical protein ABSH40_12020 [Bryobacteraceae bacterium]
MISRTRSLMFLAAAGALAQPGAWTTLQDTQERAFSVEVPQGWKAQGGMLRKGPLDPRVQIDMTSPDGRVSMRIGDFGIGGFTVPTQQMVRLGFTEGKPYSAGQPPTTTTMARYRSGRDFADLYAQARFSKMCQTLEPKSIKTEEPIFNAAHNGPSSTTAGEVVYRCVADGQEKVAFVYTETSLYEMQGTGNWMPASLLSFLAPKDRAAATYTMLFHSAASFTENPQWAMRQEQITEAQAAAAMAIFRRTLQETQARYERWSANMSKQGQNFSDALAGRTLTVDPQTGQQREVWTGTGATRWIDPLGTVASSTLSPGSSFRALVDTRH